jgi:lipoate-protein ligase B
MRVKGEIMDPIIIKGDELKELVRTAVREGLIEILTKRRDLLEDALIEAIEDIGLARAMEEADTGEYVDEEVILRKL